MKHGVKFFLWILDVTVVRVVKQFHYPVILSINDKVWVFINELESFLF